MGIKERHERERESTRRAILDAARDLFVAEGYLNTSIRKIAERIEYSPAAIYGYFPSKDDLFFALAEEGFGLLNQIGLARQRPGDDPLGDPLGDLRARLLVLLEFSHTYPEHFALMFVDRTVPRIRAHYQQFPVLREMRQRMAASVQRCIDAGVFPAQVDPLSVFRVVSSAVIGAIAARLSDRLVAGEDADALVHDVVDLCLGGLRAGVGLTFVCRAPAGCEPAAGVPASSPPQVPPSTPALPA